MISYSFSCMQFLNPIKCTNPLILVTSSDEYHATLESTGRAILLLFHRALSQDLLLSGLFCLSSNFISWNFLKLFIIWIYHNSTLSVQISILLYHGLDASRLRGQRGRNLQHRVRHRGLVQSSEQLPSQLPVRQLPAWGLLAILSRFWEMHQLVLHGLESTHLLPVP